MRRPMLWVGAYCLLSVVASVALATGILGGGFRAVERSDYVTYQTAGLIVLRGDGSCLYEVACQTAAQQHILAGQPTFAGGLLPFNSPPWLAVVAAPLALLSLPVGFGIFTVMSLGLLGVATWRLAWGGTAVRLLATLGLLSAWPTTMAAIRGQSSLAVAAVLGLAAVPAMRGGGAGVGLLTGLAAFKPTLAPLWAARLLVERRWAALAAAAGVTLVLGAATAVIASPAAVLDYPGYALRTLGDPTSAGVQVEQMINWRGAALRLDLAGSPMATAGVVGTLLVVAVAWWFARGSSRAASLGAGVAFIATPLAIPHANQHEAILAGVGVLLLLAALHEGRRWLVGAAIGTQAVLWIGPALDPSAAAWLIFALLLAWLGVGLGLAWGERSRVLPSRSGA